MRPYEAISFAGVAWNEEARAGRLLRLAKSWFSHLIIAVQASQDRTLEIARSIADRPGDRVLEHPHYGTGDASMPGLIRAVPTPWVLVVAFDEIPSQRLLWSLGEAVSQAEQDGTDAFWIPFRSITEGIRSKDTQSGHLRLFRQHLSWPASMHSRVIGSHEAWWREGHITHSRSLDEMMRDYLRYHELGSGNEGWVAHNRLMMHDACAVVAQHRGWGFVMGHEWWEQVRAIAFSEESPWSQPSS